MALECKADALCVASCFMNCLCNVLLQVVDDVLDLTVSSTVLGKPAHNDLRSGLATAPVLFAAEEQPELKPLIARRFKQEGDVNRVGSVVAVAGRALQYSC